MEYKYLAEATANKHMEFADLVNDNGICILNILCYHIEPQYKYPFLQFMMEKVPYCNNIVKEQLTFPCIILSKSYTSIKNVVLERVKTSLSTLNCDYIKVNEDMYKGILFSKDEINAYALVNITGIDVLGINFTRRSSLWFVLPSEIINTKNVCNIDVDVDIVKLLTNNPKISFLVNPNTKKNYILPDAVYTGNEIKQVQFNSVFGNNKTKVYTTCSEYYYFYRSFYDAIKDGGWLTDNKTNKICNRIVTEDNSNKYIVGGINRYALFIEGKLYLENEKDFSLTDDIIEKSYNDPCIIICYTGEHNINPDILVKKNESFISLSYHTLDKDLLGNYYTETKKKEYMIV